MRDPKTVAHEIKYPWRKYKAWPKGFSKLEDFSIYERHRFSSMWREGYRETFITIWHVDPEKDGTDDSCGWFMRARHGDQQVRNRICVRFEEDWDRTWTDNEGDGCSNKTFYRGLFMPDTGFPRMSVLGIVYNLFFMAVCEHFKVDGRSNWRKARRWMQRNMFDISLMAENPTDSLFDSITRTFATPNKEDTQRMRKERIEEIASIVYGWILRETRPWWKHPRWHVRHWEFQIHPLQDFKRWAFSRCCKCGKRFTWGYAPVTNQWHGTGPLWFRSESGVYHSDCNRPEDSGLSCEPKANA